MERVQVGQTLGQACQGRHGRDRGGDPNGSVLGQDVTGLEFARYFTREGSDPFDAKSKWELRSACSSPTNAASSYSSSATSSSLNSGRSRPPTSSVVSGKLPGADRHAGDVSALGEEQPHRPCGRHDYELGARAGLLRFRGRSAGVQRRLEAPAGLPEGLVQQPGVVQLRLREGAAVLGVLHQRRAGHDGLDLVARPAPRACCSSSDRAPARICRPSGRRANCSPAAARPRVRCRS